MKSIVLFDQDLQDYRKNIYLRFHKEFLKKGYNLKIYYDASLKSESIESELFNGITYNLKNFITTIKKHNAVIVIQFVWLRYKFLFPFMFWAIAKGIRIIVWSHGINLQRKNQPIKNNLYYLRQLLASALIIYTPQQKKYIKASHKKLFIANNTLEFNSLPNITLNKDELKEKYDYRNKIVLLSIGRFNKNNRKVKHLIELSQILDNSFQIVIVGPGVDSSQKLLIDNNDNIVYKGPIYDQLIISELYKMADIFIMPGAIGLAINQAYYFETPVILENVAHGPEFYYFNNGVNGLLYNKDDINCLAKKVRNLYSDYNRFSAAAKQTITNKASFKYMLNGFIKAIEYVENRSKN